MLEILLIYIGFIGFIVWGATAGKREENEKKRQEEETQRQLAEGIKIHCPRCKAVNDRSNKICLGCGMSMKVERKEKTTCSFCGASNNAINTTCFACGKKIKPAKINPTENKLNGSIVANKQLRLDCGKICTRILAKFRAEKDEELRFRQAIIKHAKTGSTASDFATILVTGEIQPGMPSSTVTELDEEVWNENLKKILQIFDMACGLIEQIGQKLATDDEYLLYCREIMCAFAKAELRMDDMIILMSTKQNLSVSNPVRELLMALTFNQQFREGIRLIVKSKL
ncbi:MAG: zinc ribbon domain-containing protein [Clostridia bacterium]|nr:zinc ribbon domain-containing protein [Clostridia bacterium]